MPARERLLRLSLTLALIAFSSLWLSSSCRAQVLRNSKLKLEFKNNDLILTGIGTTKGSVTLAERYWSIGTRLGNNFGSDISLYNLKPFAMDQTPTSVIFHYKASSWTIDEKFELKPDWSFISTQLSINRTDGKDFRLERIECFKAGLLDSPFPQSHRFREGALLRGQNTGKSNRFGLFFLLQNPYLSGKIGGAQATLGYTANMDWKSAWGPYKTDRVCIGVTSPTGPTVSTDLTPEWSYPPNSNSPDDTDCIYQSEIDSLTECARQFLLVHPQKSDRTHIGWCENDYQIDINTSEGRNEYRRIIDRASELGCKNLLFTPANSGASRLEDNTDAWGWENVLWLTLGQRIRTGEWDPTKSKLPSEISELLDYARHRDVRLLAYVYPTLPFMQNPEWTSWIRSQKPGGYLGADTGQRSFQDWLIEKLVAFYKSTGIGGFSFDHWWIAYDDANATSRYAQWYGCRRILEELRRRLPDAIIDGRQQYHQFGVWTWLAGTYPHPLGTDEQPQSFTAFPDLHFDRITADRQRSMAYVYRQKLFTPIELVPGFITHQTTRSDAANVMHRDAFRRRDWDQLGWKYSLLSSIATAPFHHVVNMLPARDTDEYKAFSANDASWFRNWLDWTDENMHILRRVQPILGQPAVGRLDGTAAFEGAHGFVFLFNPNYRSLSSDLILNESIGLSKEFQGKGLIIRQLFPDIEKGKLLINGDRPAFHYGDHLRMNLPGAQAFVLEIQPDIPNRKPVVFGVRAVVTLSAGTLSLTKIAGQPGTNQAIAIRLKPGTPVGRLLINGQKFAFYRRQDTVWVTIHFAGDYFEHSHQIGTYDPGFAGGKLTLVGGYPARIQDQLARRRNAWPVTYTADDLKATWLGSHRLLLFVNVAQPTEKMNPEIALRIDGAKMELKPAYSSVYPQATERTLLGWYLDISNLTTGVKHRFELDLPLLKPGQFQGLFFDNVEDELTSHIAPVVTRKIH